MSQIFFRAATAAVGAVSAVPGADTGRIAPSRAVIRRNLAVRRPSAAQVGLSGPLRPSRPAGGTPQGTPRDHPKRP